MQENYCFVYLYDENLENKNLDVYESELQQEKIKNYFSEKCGEYRAYLIKQEKKVYLLIYGHLTHFDVSLENAIPQIISPTGHENYCLSIRDPKCKHYVEKRTRFKRLRSGLNEIFNHLSFALAEIKPVKGNVEKLKEIYSSIRNSNAIKDNDLVTTQKEGSNLTQEVIKLKERIEFLENAFSNMKKTLEESKEIKEQVPLPQSLIPVKDIKKPSHVVHIENPTIEQKTSNLEHTNEKLETNPTPIITKAKDLKSTHWAYIEKSFEFFYQRYDQNAFTFIEKILPEESANMNDFPETIKIPYNSLTRRAEWKEIKKKVDIFT